MTASVSQLIQSQDLLWTWVGRSIRARYQQSILGGLWMVVQPIATVIIFTIVFTRFVPINTGSTPYVAFSYVALFPWLLLANSLTDMSDSLITNMGLVTKIYFPREILPIAALLARLVDFLIAAAVLVLLLLYLNVPVFSVAWVYFPLVLMTQLMFLVGLGLFAAAANVFYRDVKPLLTLGIQLWFYASPIIYPVTMVPENLRPFYFLNPMAGILTAYRDIVLYGIVPGAYLGFAGIVAVVVLVAGYWFFKRVEFQFADIV